MRAQIDMINDAVDLLRREQTLMQALVKEIVVQHDDFVNSAHLLELLLELVEIGLEHFKKHVVQVVLAELEHLVSRSVRLCEHALDVAFFSRLMDGPSALKTILNILLEEQMSEDQLVLVDDLLGDDQAEWPLHVVFQSQCLIYLERA